MVKNIAYHFLVLTAIIAVVISVAVPHHHHGDETVICMGNDLHAYESDHCCDCCASEETASKGDCCNLKNNLITYQSDSRKEHFNCDCDSPQHFRGGDTFILISFLLDDSLLPVKLPDESYNFTPYTNLYHSVLTECHIGLRAPPTT